MPSFLAIDNNLLLIVCQSLLEAEGLNRIAVVVQLERVAIGHLQNILAGSGTIEAVVTQTRTLGLRPNDTLVSAVAQAFHAARVPLPNGS